MSVVNPNAFTTYWGRHGRKYLLCVAQVGLIDGMHVEPRTHLQKVLRKLDDLPIGPSTRFAFARVSSGGAGQKLTSGTSATRMICAMATRLPFASLISFKIAAGVGFGRGSPYTQRVDSD